MGASRPNVTALAALMLLAAAAPGWAADDPPAVAPPSIAVPAIALPDLPDAPVTITVADQVSAIIAARLADPAFRLVPRLGQREREGIAAFYALGAFAPVWTDADGWTSAARGLAAVLQDAAADGLAARDYALPIVPPRGAGATTLAEAELRLAAAMVLYARDARGGRIEPGRLSRLITPKLDLPAADGVLTTLAAAGPAASGILSAYNPRHPGYQALRAKLAEIRQRQPLAEPVLRLPDGPVLRAGMQDRRVPLIRARFGIGPLPGDADTAYDRRVAVVVAGFQKEHGLAASGILTRETVAALGRASTSRLEGEIIANMERWRWLPAELGERYVMVNIPEFETRIVEAGRTRYEARVIVGKPDTPTPLFSGTMEYAVVNPSWNIPPSILKNEILPRLAQDPSYAARLGYEVVRRGNTISVRQPPGERNALGFIKFMFPNQHAVYLHDTPNRTLFGTAKRAFSHGCVRVDQPFRLAEMVLGPAWPTDRLKNLIGKGERTIRLPRTLPVHLAYFTAFVDAGGTLRSAADVYGYDQQVKSALGL